MAFSAKFQLLIATLAVAFLTAGCPGVVPDVVGMQESEARAALTDAGLTVGTVGLANSATIPQGRVISQDPPAGAMLTDGSVDLVVSLGPAPVMVQVPAVTGLDEEAAQAAIAAAGLAVGDVTGAYDPIVAAGLVVSQSPAAGLSVASGSDVNVVLSLGPQPVIVPNLAGMDNAEAQAALAAAGLTVGSISEEFSAATAAAHVISQTPAAGVAVLPGTAVDLVVSKGPEPGAVPYVKGLTAAQAQSSILFAGLAVGHVGEAYSLAVPAGRVLSQSPAPGTVVAAQTFVDFVVSLGPEPVPVPDLVGMTQAAAEAALPAARLTLGAVIEEYTPLFPPGTVFRQDPEAGAVILEQSPVNLVIATDYRLISTIEQLQDIGNDPEYPLNAKYALIQDIDAAETEQWNDGAGFIPIMSFSGIFDGRGHAVSNLSINSDWSASLFDGVGPEATVKDLRLNMNASNGWFVGGIASMNSGTILNCFVDGVFSGYSMFAGGIAGMNDEGGLISGCTFDGQIEVSGELWYCGGIVAWNKGDVDDCLFSGEIRSDSYGGWSDTGGIAGSNEMGVIAGCTSSGQIWSELHAGGIAGGNTAYIADCYSACAVTVANGDAGGVAGFNGGFITGCGSSGPVKASGNYAASAGGIAGGNGGVIDRCYATGFVAGRNLGTGGLAGSNSWEITDSFSYSSVTAEAMGGGLVGVNRGRVDRCYAAGLVTCLLDAGGLIGASEGSATDSFWCADLTDQAVSAGGTAITLSQLLDSATFEAAGWDFADDDGSPAVWAQIDDVTVPYLYSSVEPGTLYALEVSAVNGEVAATPAPGELPAWAFVRLEPTAAPPNELAGWDAPAFCMPDLIQAETLHLVMFEPMTVQAVFLQRPVVIDSIEDLQRIGLEALFPLHWDYVLAADLDATPTTGWNEGARFCPIGDIERPFSGSLDGQGHIIDGLFINKSVEDREAYAGLFGMIAEGGAVHNLQLTNATVAAYESVGLIAAVNSGEITDCRVSGSVTGRYCVGGVAGINGPYDIYDIQYPFRTYSGLILRCRADVTVTGAYTEYSYTEYGAELGGLVGANAAAIRQSAATGAVTGSEDVGGLAGAHVIGVIEDSYASGDVIGDAYVGGFIGISVYSTTLRSYSAGRITATDNGYYGYVGGFVGYNEPLLQQYCYWDFEASGLDWNGGGGRTTAEMMTAATFTNWDFLNVWGIDEGNSYPYLLWEVEVAE